MKQDNAGKTASPAVSPASPISPVSIGEKEDPILTLYKKMASFWNHATNVPLTPEEASVLFEHICAHDAYPPATIDALFYQTALTEELLTNMIARDGLAVKVRDRLQAIHRFIYTIKTQKELLLYVPMTPDIKKFNYNNLLHARLETACLEGLSELVITMVCEPKIAKILRARIVLIENIFKLVTKHIQELTRDGKNPEKLARMLIIKKHLDVLLDRRKLTQLLEQMDDVAQGLSDVKISDDQAHFVLDTVYETSLITPGTKLGHLDCLFRQKMIAQRKLKDITHGQSDLKDPVVGLVCGLESLTYRTLTITEIIEACEKNDNLLNYLATRLELAVEEEEEELVREILVRYKDNLDPKRLEEILVQTEEKFDAFSKRLSETEQATSTQFQRIRRIIKLLVDCQNYFACIKLDKLEAGEENAVALDTKESDIIFEYAFHTNNPTRLYRVFKHGIVTQELLHEALQWEAPSREIHDFVQAMHIFFYETHSPEALATLLKNNTIAGLRLGDINFYDYLAKRLELAEEEENYDLAEYIITHHADHLQNHQYIIEYVVHSLTEKIGPSAPNSRKIVTIIGHLKDLMPTHEPTHTEDSHAGTPVDTPRSRMLYIPTDDDAAKIVAAV